MANPRDKFFRSLPLSQDCLGRFRTAKEPNEISGELKRLTRDASIFPNLALSLRFDQALLAKVDAE